MTDNSVTAGRDVEKNQQPSAPSRKPWHAPQFIQTDIAGTDVQTGAPNDGPYTAS